MLENEASQNHKYTFIIPVYNVEDYLDECVESVLAQTYSGYQIILVDDGSNDSSGMMCDIYARRDARISVIHKENGGLSSARNTGLRAASSEYVIFLDSDDYWCDEGGLAKIDELAEKRAVDIIAFASRDLYQISGRTVDDRYDYPESLNGLSSEQCIKQMISTDLLNMSAAKKCYRRSFLVDNDLYFVEGLRSEDVEQGLRTLIYLPTYAFLNEKLYVYRHRAGSISTTVDRKHIEDYIRIIDNTVGYAYSNEIYEYIMSYIGYQYALLLAHITAVDDGSYKDILSYLKKYRYLFKYYKYKRTRLISIFYMFSGYTLTRIALSTYLRRGH